MGRLADIADHFRRRSITHGQEGLFGALQTQHLRLRTVYTGLASLIDNPNLSILLEGARGTGKARIIEEFLRLENIYRNLLGLPPSRLCKVSPLTRNDILDALIHKSDIDVPTLFYFPNLLELTLRDQEILVTLLKRQDRQEQSYRLAFGCEQGLSFMIQRGQILSEVVDYLRLHNFPIPRLSERSDDFAIILSDLIKRYSNKSLPNRECLDYLLTLDYPENIDSLASLVKQALNLAPNPQAWSPKLIQSAYPLARVERTEKILDFNRRVR